MKRHNELDWHRQCQHSRYSNEVIPMATRTIRHRKRKPYSYGFSFNDGALIVLLVVLSLLLWLDTFVFGGALQ